jgi:hypothetical protein
MQRLSALVGAALLLGACEQERGWQASIEGSREPAESVAETEALQRTASTAISSTGEEPEKRILFGDLHVHTSYSWDAYLFTLPLFGGEGAHPPADACDFARYCANLDFYALTDHAEALLPAHWELAKESVRLCNERAGSPEDPDMVAFTGFEWTQAGLTPEDHYGHRCLIFPDDDALPTRPIAAADRSAGYLQMRGMFERVRWLQPWHFGVYQDAIEHLDRLGAREVCPMDRASPEITGACLEVAPTPADLHRKLDEWGLEVLEIPHGTAWGVYTPATTSIDKHLTPAQFDTDRQRLIEIMSGHGNSEEYRDWRHFEIGPDGERTCLAPSEDFLPCCWQAGEIMRQRCGDLPEAECERRVELAREYAMAAWVNPAAVFPDATAQEWLDCGQCRDCFKPAFNQRPMETVQYAMALSNFERSDPLRFRYGFIGSSDIHDARAGTGYKQQDLEFVTDGGASPALERASARAARAVDPQMPQNPHGRVTGLTGNDPRTRDFLYGSGLAVVHARSRSRADIWAALREREVYGTSGPRILLWFDLVTRYGNRFPMGSERVQESEPRFEVRAVGSFEQKPGCPDWARYGLSDERLEWLCRGECYHPGEMRRSIERIEIVRIRPQERPGEPLAALIEDPWRVFDCPDDPAGCRVEFVDDEFVASGRDTLYYARALEEESDAVQGRPLHPQRDASGRVVSVTLCGDPALGPDCLGRVQERAWSSPIFLNQRY